MKRTPPILLALVLTITPTAWAQRAASQPPASPSPSEPKHLAVARSLVAHLDLDNTSYKHGEPDVSFADPYKSHADCSGFIDLLLQHCYGYNKEQFKKWFDSSRPSARRYHDAIAEQKGFTLIQRVQDVLPGDLLAVKYLNRTDNTGHVMLVADRPVKIESKKPVIPDTQQWSVKVIDSSESGHGPTDTRYARGPADKDHEGAGEGIFRISTDAEGRVAGFAWSTLAASKFRGPADEHLVIGRLMPGFRPG